jgi:hypothetical protein
MSIITTHITKSVLIGLALLTSILVFHHPARAADQPNVLIMGDDADEDTVPRHSRIFNRVSDALANRMLELGFKVYNETATTMDITNPGRVRRTDAELISVAQNITSAPIDVIAVFQIYASANQNAYSDIMQLRIRVVGRMLQVQTGRDLGGFEVGVGPRGLKPLPPNCNRDCILEHVGDEAKPIANEVGTVLARKLDELSPTAPRSGKVVLQPAPVVPPPAPAPEVTAAKGCVGLSTAYTIVLSGFDPEDIGAIERMLVAFQGYEHHRPVRTETRYAEYWYETCSDRARLERNLRTMVDQMAGQNRLALSGNRFEIEKIPGVGKR